jgi:hypothetical protein
MAVNDPGSYNENANGSVTTWYEDGTTYYIEPGQPCQIGDPYGTNGYVDGVASSPNAFTQTTAEVCPQAGFPAACLDLYISACNWYIVAGDCRGPNPGAAPGLSRAQILVPAYRRDTALAYFTVTESCFPGVPLCHAPLDDTHNRVHLTYFGDDSVKVEFRLENALLTLGGSIPNPTIDGWVMLRNMGQGYLRLSAMDRDNYPTLSIFGWNSGTYFIAQRDEQSGLNLINAYGVRDRMSCVIP